MKTASRSIVAGLLQMAKAVVLDFDGTLVDSNTIKRQAFDVCFSEFPEFMPAIQTYCYSHNHTPRWEKFRYVYEQILKRPYTPEINTELHRRYEAATTSQIIAAPEIPGAGAFLQHLCSKPAVAVVSSTPQDILQHILRSRRWDRYFHVIQGAPVDKAAWLREYAQKNPWAKEERLFFGDTQEDARASKAADWAFVAVVNRELESQAQGFIAHWQELVGTHDVRTTV
jgi:beta-phosphoglucomutase-like phosphatase (HAD superfamily)